MKRKLRREITRTARDCLFLTFSKNESPLIHLEDVSISRVDSEEVEKVVQSTIKGIKSGLEEGFEIKGNIKFELAVMTVKEGEGGIKILIADAGAKASKEALSKITFEVGAIETNIGIVA